jgi:hypothetical protein
MTLIIALKHYLDTLRFEEQFKAADERRLVPTVAELAGEVGVSKQHLYKLLNNDTTVLNLTHVDGILKALRQRGFPTKVDDLLEFRD